MQIAALNSYSDLELALMVLLGYFGNGKDREKALGSRFTKVQNVVNEIWNTGKIPSGSGSASADQVIKAVRSVFNNQIDEIAEDILNELT